MRGKPGGRCSDRNWNRSEPRSSSTGQERHYFFSMICVFDGVNALFSSILIYFKGLLKLLFVYAACEVLIENLIDIHSFLLLI